MSIGQTFPDIVIMPDGSYRLVTYAARSWVYQNTSAKRECDGIEDMPRYIWLVDWLTEEMRLDGLVVRTTKVPLSPEFQSPAKRQ